MFKIWLIYENLNSLAGVLGFIMNEVKSFIIGFSLSILGVSLYSQASSLDTEPLPSPRQDLRISLFKDNNTSTIINTPAKIKKTTFSSEGDLSTQLAANKTSVSTNIQENTILITTENADEVEGLEDDEIININTDELIPIAFNNESDILGATPPMDSNEDKVASLPVENINNNSPWITAKGNLSPKNKLLPENLNNNLTLSKQEDATFIPYNIAEKIKQSIIFPIPEEILSDENLTPTFIQKTKQETQKNKLELIEKKKVEKETSNTDTLNNPSNWLDTPKKDTPKPLPSPIYNSQAQTSTKANIVNKQIKQTKMKDIGDLYEAMQETKKQNSQRKILPSELKLTFNHERAEISGQTLRWIKAFAEKTLNNEYYLTINLNSSTPTELQRKRLNLLYTLLSNDGVDVNKVDTTFSQVGQDIFIIRLVKNNQNIIWGD